MKLLVISIHSDTAFTVICEKMTPYIAFSKSENQLTCMCSDMTRHHDQITDGETEAHTEEADLRALGRWVGPQRV